MTIVFFAWSDFDEVVKAAPTDMNARSRKFFSYYAPFKGLLAADLLCALLMSVTALLIPLCVRYITANLLETITDDTARQIYQMGAVMFVLVLIYTLSALFVSYQGHIMGAMMERNMRNELFAHLQKQPFSFFDTRKTGQLMSRMTNDLFNMGELFHHGPEDIIISLLNFVGAAIILLSIDAEMAIIVFLFLPVMSAHVVYFTRKMRRAMALSKQRIGDINAQVEDTLAGIRVVQSFANEPYEQAKFAEANEQFLDSKRMEHRSEAAFYEGMIFYVQILPVAVVVFGGIAIARDSFNLPNLIAFLLYIGILLEPIRRFSNFVRLYQEGMTGFERFMEILDLDPAIQDAPDAIELQNVRGEIEFRNVSFTYRKAQPTVLQNLSLHIKAGEYVALVGASGVGKTTLCALIPRFYEVDEGAVCLDGHTVNTLSLHSLRQSIGMVQQDVYLFAGTVAENIGYGMADASREAIVAAAKQAHAHDFINALPNGYDTDIGQRGITLSGGQKQRLSIARVFLKNPPILIFDEATSALDNESEQAVQQSLEHLSSNRTTIVIAHRLTTIQNAQRIVIMDGNGIAEQGRHDELLAANGLYAKLHNLHARL